MAKHLSPAAASTTPAPADTPLPPVLHWSISDGWTWLGHAWKSFIHFPYLGIIALVLAVLVFTRALHKLLA